MTPYLAVERRRVVAAPKLREEICIWANLWVKLDPNHLHMVGCSRAHKFVIWIWDMALRIPDFSLDYTHHSLKRQFHSPEAPRSELGEFMSRVFWKVLIRFQGWVVGCHFFQNPAISDCNRLCNCNSYREYVARFTGREMSQNQRQCDEYESECSQIHYSINSNEFSTSPVTSGYEVSISTLLRLHQTFGFIWVGLYNPIGKAPIEA